MNRPVLILPIALLLAPIPLGAEPAEKAVVSIPQPVLLDFGNQFRLNSPPTNISDARLKQSAAEEELRKRRADERAAPATTRIPLGPEDAAKTKFTTRTPTADRSSLNVQTPLNAGPVSIGASFGQYRAVPGASARAVEAQDARVSLGVHF